MAPKKELRFAYGLTILLFIAGIMSYGAFPAKAPERPVRLMFKSAAGHVLFDHKTHTSAFGYALSCKDCHHHPEEDEQNLLPCGYCHTLPEEGKTTPEGCADCHDPEDIEYAKMIKKADAFHSQCIECHKEYGAGPEECQSCHIM